MPDYLRIGQVARLTGFSVKAIRYYEAAGVLPPPGRSEGRYRLFNREDIRRLGLIKLAKRLGFTLREAGELLAIADMGCCVTVRPGVRRLLDRKQRQIDALVRNLQMLRARLDSYATRLPAQAARGGASCTPDRCLPEVPIALLSVSSPNHDRL